MTIGFAKLPQGLVWVVAALIRILDFWPLRLFTDLGRSAFGVAAEREAPDVSEIGTQQCCDNLH